MKIWQSQIKKTEMSNEENPVPQSRTGAIMKTTKRTTIARQLNLGASLVATGAMLVSFQNCAQPGSTATADGSDPSVQALSASGSASAASFTGAGLSSPDYPSDVVFRDPYTPSHLSAYGCAHVTTLTAPTDGSALVIPARTGPSSGECYAVKLMNGVDLPTSASNPIKDGDLITRNHDLSGYSASDVHVPYSMGNSRLSLYLQGERSVLITGGPDQNAKIAVDNFLLVGLTPTAQYGNPYYYLAYGTSDATVLFNGNTSDVLFHNQPVYLEPYAVGGTAQIPPISLDNKISSQVYYTLDTRAIDCGGKGYLSDLYVLFQ